MIRVKVTCLVCSATQIRPPAAVTLILRKGKTPRYTFACMDCGDTNEREACDEQVTAMLDARCPIDHDAGDVDFYAERDRLTRDLEETT